MQILIHTTGRCSRFVLVLLPIFRVPIDALMFKQYPDTPNSWYAAILVSALITATVLIYKTDSTLPW